MAKIQKKTIDQRIKERLYSELTERRQLVADKVVIDQVLIETTNRLDDHIKQIAIEIQRQQAAMGHLAELREQQETLSHRTNETTMLAANLAEVFFRSDIKLLVRHLEFADDDIIIKALSGDPDLLKKITGIISRIDSLEKGIKLND